MALLPPVIIDDIIEDIGSAASIQSLGGLENVRRQFYKMSHGLKITCPELGEEEVHELALEELKNILNAF